MSSWDTLSSHTLEFLLENTKKINEVIEDIRKFFVTVAHITTGKFNIFCKVRAHDTKELLKILYL